MSKINKMACFAVLLSAPTLVFAEGDWTGLYVGGHIAYTDAEASAGSVSISDNAGAYGLHAGYNFSVNQHFVLGGELSYGTAEYSFAGITGDIDTTRLKGKAGMSLDNAMVYGVLGWTDLDDGSDSESGVVFGAGYAFKATDNIMITGEILQDQVDLQGIDIDVTSFILGLSYQF